MKKSINTHIKINKLHFCCFAIIYFSERTGAIKMIYLCDDMKNIPADIIRETHQIMPSERRQRALRYRSDIDKNSCVLAYWLLMFGLKQEHGIAEPPIFTYGENGKPYLADYDNIFFNISHCKVGVICAISDVEVGVDIQDVRPFDIAIAKRVCTEYELEQLALCHKPERPFCKLWTIKESFVKMYGGIIADSLNTLYATALYEQLSSNAISYWDEAYHICCFGVEKGTLQKIKFENGATTVQ